MREVSKFRIKWLFTVIFVTVIGFFLLLHGGVAVESAARANESHLIYKLEVYLGWVLLWPIKVYSWIYSFFSISKVQSLGYEIWFFHFMGYLCLYKIYEKKYFKNT